MNFDNILRDFIDLFAFFFQAIPLLIFEIFKPVFTIFIAEKPFKNVRGKLALITGSGGGLGREIALKLAELGCDIAVVDINEAAAMAVAKEIKQTGVISKSYKTDISKKEEVKKLQDDVTREMGKVDILVCNAGLIPNQAEDEIEEDFLKAMIDVNVFGTILVNFARF
jgi:all-trans-retinol dehydrogenase (NAD+)